MYFKNCTIIYGYSPDINTDMDEHTILIEPRKLFIDMIKKNRFTKNILITKALVKSNGLKETHLYYNDQSKQYLIEDSNITEYASSYNKKISSKEIVYTLSLETIIQQYKIQNINKLILNINVNNCNDIIESIHPSNQIVSNIYINKNIDQFIKEKCSILNNFKDKETTDYNIFYHKNLNIEIPKIGMFITSDVSSQESLDKLLLFIQQYQLSLIIHNEYISYPESLSKIKNLSKIQNKSKLFHEIISDNLDKIFIHNDNNNENEHQSKNENENDLDILIQFNPKYLNDKNTLQIMYPLKDNILYINKMFDIIYATKNCMYMLYQIIKSKYFTDYLEEKKNKKPSLFKMFSKKYFYEYISKIFTIKEI